MRKSRDGFLMNLLIIGAGGFGKVVKELASSSYASISFIDDNPDADEAVVGNIADLKDRGDAFKEKYDEVAVSIGDNSLRGRLIEVLINKGFKLATIVSPLASVSPSATVGVGSVVSPFARVNANSVVGRGVILSSGAVVDHNSVVEDYVLLDSNSVVETGVTVGRGSYLSPNSVASNGYKLNRIKTATNMAVANPDDEWVKSYIEKNGEEPNFF